jgi:HPt (histidine-containing phosphotransfer) domain-containing protein
LKQVQHLLKYGLKARSSNVAHQPIHSQEVITGQILDIRKGLEQVGGDIKTYAELLSDLIRELPERLQTIQDLFDAKDWVRLSRAAHNLSGIGASLGAAQLADDSRRLEKQSTEDAIESIDGLLRDMRVTSSHLVEAVNKFLVDNKIEVGSL